MLSFGHEGKTNAAGIQANQGVDDLVAHFENFNMEDLGATGSPMLQRSMTERNILSPAQDHQHKQQ